MPTISLCSGKLNRMPGLLRETRRAVLDYKEELSALRQKTLQISRDICDLEETARLVQASTQLQEEKAASLEAFRRNTEQFAEEAARVDGEAAELVRQRKEEFYGRYRCLKPGCEQTGWEAFCEGCQKAGDWCREHWKLASTVVLVIAALAVIVFTAGMALGPLALLLAGAAKGLLLGAIAGGLLGGLSAVAAGGSFWEGFEEGAFAGALSGALFGGLGAAGQLFGRAFGASCTVFRAVRCTALVSGSLSLGLAGFDLLSLGAGLSLGPDNALTVWNARLHANPWYNLTQFAVTALAVFTGSAYRTMKPRERICFVAGTLIRTAGGFTAIEQLRAGERVLSTDPETGELLEKPVPETYVRRASRLVCLRVGGETLRTTPGHPFYVTGRGFVRAGDLKAGERLCDIAGNAILLEEVRQEDLEKPVRVYNFQVADFHTYHVGRIGVLVHNAGSGYGEGEAETGKTKGEDVKFGSNAKSEQKLNNQMHKRGWTEQSVRDTIDSPYTTRNSTNKATGNPSTVYYTKEGSYVIVDDVTKEIVQVSDNINPSTWAPDTSIVDPYILE